VPSVEVRETASEARPRGRGRKSEAHAADSATARASSASCALQVAARVEVREVVRQVPKVEAGSGLPGALSGAFRCGSSLCVLCTEVQFVEKKIPKPVIQYAAQTHESP